MQKPCVSSSGIWKARNQVSVVLPKAPPFAKIFFLILENIRRGDVLVLDCPVRATAPYLMRIRWACDDYHFIILVALIAHYLMQIHWTCAARTDKGLSAVGQMVALKLLAEGDEILIQRINDQ